MGEVGKKTVISRVTDAANILVACIGAVGISMMWGAFALAVVRFFWHPSANQALFFVFLPVVMASMSYPIFYWKSYVKMFGVEEPAAVVSRQPEKPPELEEP